MHAEVEEIRRKLGSVKQWEAMAAQAVIEAKVKAEQARQASLKANETQAAAHQQAEALVYAQQGKVRLKQSILRKLNVYTVGRPLGRDVLSGFLSEFLVTNWAVQ